VLAPEPDTISIRATVRLTPEGKPRHLRVLMNHQLIRSLYLEQPETPLEVNDLSLNGGSNDLVFETDEPGKKFGSDPRNLALSIRDLGIVQPPPSSLSLRDGSEVASVQGLTPDRWITAAGAEADLGVPAATSEVLVKVEGEAINGTVPGELALIFDGQTLHSEKIIKSGPTTLTFSVPLKHPTGTLRLRLLPKTTARPVDLNMGADTRQLGFRLSAIKVVRALAR
jgi:hypothetical protein